MMARVNNLCTELGMKEKTIVIPVLKNNSTTV
jgi:hypothetical protein